MLDRIFKIGFMLAVAFFVYSAGVVVNMFDIWPNGMYVKALKSTEKAPKPRHRRKH